MKISYANDAAKGAGHGFLELRGASLDAGPCRLSLQRSSDHRFLGPAGQWSSQKSFLTLEGRQHESCFQIPLGPEIVDNLAPGETCRVSLTDSGGHEISGTFQAREIAFSPAGTVDNALVPQGGEPEAPEQPAPREPAAEEPEVQQAEPLVLEGTSERRTDPRRWRIPALLLLAGIVLAWYFLHTPPSGTAPAGREEAAARVEQPTQTPGGNAVTPTPGPAPGAPQRVRDFFLSPAPSAESAMSLAGQITPQGPGDEDALYRLYYFAAGKGDAQGLMLYARCLDPSTPAWGSIGKDAPVALESYRRASAGGAGASAASAISELRTWLDRAAAGGDERARAWLDQIRISNP